MNEIVSTSADAAVRYLLVGSVAAAAMLTSSGLSQAGSTDTPVRPQEETLGPSERRPTGNCSLSGRVISDETGEPVGHATAYLFCISTHDAIFIRVASDGSFVFQDIPADDYTLRTTNTAGYQEVSYNPEGRQGSFLQFTLNENERRTNIVLKAKPASSISGMVLDESGNPLSNVKLWVVAWQETDEIDSETKESRLNMSLKPGVTIRGKFVDTDGKKIEFDSPAYGLAYRYGYSNPESMSWSGSANRYTIAQRKHGTTFNGGAGDYEEEYMDFPTASTFFIEGMLPGQTVLRFEPKASDAVVQSILYKDQDVTTTGIDTQANREIQDVTIVIARPAPLRPPR